MVLSEYLDTRQPQATPNSHGQQSLKQVNYISYGSGHPVVCLHGMAASLHDWILLGPALAQHGFAAYAPDLLGHGDSDKPIEPDQYHLEKVHNHMMAWLDGMQLATPAIFIGHSMGGYLALLTALRYPERLSALILIDPLYRPSQLSPLIRAVRHLPHLGVRGWQVVPEWLINLLLGWDPISADNFTPAARRQIAIDYKRASPNVVYLATEIPDLTEEVRLITCPTLIIWGEQDLTLTPRSFERLAKIIPHAVRYPIAGSGHQPHIGKPKLVNQVILDFLSSWSSVDAKGSQRQNATP